jgi:phosphomannomutase
MIKDKIPLGSLSFEGILKDKIKNSFSQATFNEEDGLKIILENSKQWIHIRPSNTEPILRIYAEGPDEMSLKKLLDKFKNLLNT